MKLEEIKKEVLSFIDKDELGNIAISGADLPQKGFHGNAIAKAVRDTGYPTYIAVGWNPATKKPIIKYDPEACKGKIVKYLFVYLYSESDKAPEKTPHKDPDKTSYKSPVINLDTDDDNDVDDFSDTPVESMKVKEVVAELKRWGYTDEDINQLDGIYTKRQELKNARQLGGRL